MERDRYLKQLLDVIRVLRGSELDLAKKHLKAYETNHTANNPKMFQLYKYITIKHIRDYERLKKRVSPDSTDDSFNKLIRRTLDRIQESLIIDVNIRRKGAYSDVFKMRFFTRKLSMQAQILAGRGLVERPLIIFDTIEKYAKKYELYDELIDSLNFKQSLILNVKGVRAFEKLVTETEYFENCRNLLSKSRRIQRSYDAQLTSKANVGKVSSKIKRQVEKLFQYYEETGSANILTFYFLIKIDIYKTDGKIKEASELMRKLISLLRSSSAVFSANRIAYMQNELVSAEFRLLRFHKALVEIDETVRWLKSINLIYLDVNLKRLNVLIFLKEYELTLNKVKQIEDIDLLKKHPLYIART